MSDTEKRSLFLYTDGVNGDYISYNYYVIYYYINTLLYHYYYIIFLANACICIS